MTKGQKNKWKNDYVLLRYLCHEMIWPGIHRLFKSQHPNNCTKYPSQKNRLWISGFGVFNLNSLIIFMLFYFHYFRSYITMLDFKLDNFGINWEDLQLIFSYVTVFKIPYLKIFLNETQVMSFEGGFWFKMTINCILK